ncbi:hypothetical protein AB0I53_08065 [Saccharopolyspora sp. NPDC050389]|uniref:hypothetical protein n=1 Tax=Saccharopolyspora sp. NPDC050389 TaxID=3155516 RepID=UPI0033E231CE
MAGRLQVVVVGAGYAGVMAVNRIAAAGHRDVEVTVVNPRSRFVERLRLHQHAAGTDDGNVVASDCTIWAGSFEVPDLALRSGLPVDEHARLLTDETLVCVDHPRIVGVGDAAAPPTGVAVHLRMSCQAAIPMGAHGADTVLALIRGQEPGSLSVGLGGQAVSLGRRAALIQAARADDSPRRFMLSGRPAAVVKEFVCRSTVASIRRKPATYRWLPRPQPTRAGEEKAVR